MASHEKIIANVPQNLYYHHQGYSEEDELSFCDLPMHNNDTESSAFSTCPTSEDDQEDDDPFEFLTSPEAKPATDQTIVFCGKPIVGAKQVHHPKKGLFVRRDQYSFKKCQYYNGNNNTRSDVVVSVKTPTSVGAPKRSNSFRFGGGTNKAASSPENRGYLYNRRGNDGSRKNKVNCIGLVMKVQSEMELSDIRKRQGRRSPAPMFPATGGSGEQESGGRSYWALLRPLLCRVHFMSALSKATFGCLSHV